MKNDMLSGGVLVDKPEGLTSAEVVRRLKRKLPPRTKIGHAGTLDPLATGLLIVLVGRATRLQSVFLESSKSYQGVLRLGLRTDTDDITGEVIERVEDLLSTDDLKQKLPKLREQFLGNHLQVPPQFSAVQVDGERSYQRARRGEKTELKAREIIVEELELEVLTAETMAIKVRASKGTYVRALARDIGKALGVGACLESLRRTASGDLYLAQAVPLASLLERESLEGITLPVADLLVHLPSVSLEQTYCQRLRAGDQSPLLSKSLRRELENASGLASVRDSTGSLVCLIERKSSQSMESIWKIRAGF